MNEEGIQLLVLLIALRLHAVDFLHQLLVGLILAEQLVFQVVGCRAAGLQLAKKLLPIRDQLLVGGLLASHLHVQLLVVLLLGCKLGHYVGFLLVGLGQLLDQGLELLGDARLILLGLRQPAHELRLLLPRQLKLAVGLVQGLHHMLQLLRAACLLELRVVVEGFVCRLQLRDLRVKFLHDLALLFQLLLHGSLQLACPLSRFGHRLVDLRKLRFQGLDLVLATGPVIERLDHALLLGSPRDEAGGTHGPRPALAGPSRECRRDTCGGGGRGCEDVG
mmetsp:Transcript_54634/g.177539  ORF Transcript_54634/g.177539 Transcript_54634/m.177539 type:complete len:277 (-) Transcript_54634:194-1024(-)